MIFRYGLLVLLFAYKAFLSATPNGHIYELICAFLLSVPRKRASAYGMRGNQAAALEQC